MEWYYVEINEVNFIMLLGPLLIAFIPAVIILALTKWFSKKEFLFFMSKKCSNDSSKICSFHLDGYKYMQDHK